MDNEEAIKIIKDEYEKKLTEQKQAYEEKINVINENHAKQIRAILTTGKPEKEPEKEPENYEEDLLKKLTKKLKLKEN